MQYPGIIVEKEINGRLIRFFVSNLRDIIQNCHINEQFYESEELAIIGRHFKPGQVFLDVGANIGNHAIYVEKFLEPKSVIVVEPSPPALAILRFNLLFNQTSRIETKYLGIGLSDQEQTVVVKVPANNLGGTRLEPQAGSDIRVCPGDRLFANLTIDFIKLDVEGYELRALRGLEQTISKNRPAIFVEIDNELISAFSDWTRSQHYRIVERFRRYPENENFLMLPA